MKPKNRSRKMARASLLEILNFYPISETDAYKLAKVDRRTWARWKSGQANPPAAVVDLIKLYALGELPSPAWSGFRLVNGLLFDPSGFAYTPADVRALAILKQHSARYLGLLRAQDARREARDDQQAAPVLRLVKAG